MNKGIVISIFVFLMIVAGLIYFGIEQQNREDEKRFSSILIKNNKLLSSEDYVGFIKIDNSRLKYFNKETIIDRLEQHPYISSITASEDKNTLVLTIKERELKAKLITENDVYLISKDLRVLPVMNVSMNVDLPVLSNYRNNKIKIFSLLKEKEVYDAIRILDASEEINNDFYKSISEINLNKGEGLKLIINDLMPEVYYGKSFDLKKLYALAFLLGNTEEKRKAEICDYLDLRFANTIFFRNTVNTTDTI